MSGSASTTTDESATARATASATAVTRRWSRRITPWDSISQLAHRNGEAVAQQRAELGPLADDDHSGHHEIQRPDADPRRSMNRFEQRKFRRELREPNAEQDRRLPHAD